MSIPQAAHVYRATPRRRHRERLGVGPKQTSTDTSAKVPSSSIATPQRAPPPPSCILHRTAASVKLEVLPSSWCYASTGSRMECF